MRLTTRRLPAAVPQSLFVRIVAQAREPLFYIDAGVPDTLDGRFEMMGLHLYMVLRRLRQEEAHPREAADLAQSLFDTAFANMDQNLREMGVGDLSVGTKVKQMARGFYGRVAAYDAGLADDADDEVEAALVRNLFGTVAPRPAQVSAMARYLRRENDNLSAQTFTDIAAGRVSFGAPPAVE